MEFTEECLTVFWISVFALLCVFFFGYMAPGPRWHDHFDTCITYISKVTFNQESWQYVRYSVYMLICHSLLKGFSVLKHYPFKKIINLQKFSVQSCHHMHKGSYAGELHCLLLQPWRQPYLTRLREEIWYLWYGGPQWTVRSSVQYYPSQFAGLGNYFPCSSADIYAWALICCF